MNYEVEKTEIHSGYAITFPFELKDAFRSSFKSAKWNSMLKRWEVGNRSGSRLEEWISEIKRSGVLESLKVLNCV